MKEYVFTAVVRKDGMGSKKIAVTKACQALGLEAGDYIKVTIERAEEDA